MKKMCEKEEQGEIAIRISYLRRKNILDELWEAGRTIDHLKDHLWYMLFQKERRSLEEVKLTAQLITAAYAGIKTRFERLGEGYDTFVALDHGPEATDAEAQETTKL